MGPIKGIPTRPEAAAEVLSRRRVRLGAFVLVAFLLPLVLSFTSLGVSRAFAISRDAALARGQSWIDFPVGYSQARHHLGYRTDCSGYVSMCWRTGTSW